MLLNFHEGEQMRRAYCPSLHWICYVSGALSRFETCLSRFSDGGLRRSASVNLFQVFKLNCCVALGRRRLLRCLSKPGGSSSSVAGTPAASVDRSSRVTGPKTAGCLFLRVRTSTCIVLPPVTITCVMMINSSIFAHVRPPLCTFLATPF